MRSRRLHASLLVPPLWLLLLLPGVSCWDGWQTMRPIGHVRSCFSEKFGTPRQGSLVPDAAAMLTIELEDMEVHQALEGLDAYSHVWLVWMAHLNGHDATNSKVRAPKLRGGRAGVFATRSPYRPNPIGLSLVRLLGVDGDTLQLSGVDLVDGTPVVDVKPYIPSYDTPAVELPEDVRTASWVDPPPLPVRLAPEVEAALEGAIGRSSSMLQDADQLRRALVQTLAADPRPLYRWRRERGAGGAEYDIAFDGLCARCAFELGSTGVESVTVLQLTAAGDGGGGVRA